VQRHVVGGWSIVRAMLRMDGQVEIRVAFDANYPKCSKKASGVWYAREVWVFTQSPGEVKPPG